MYQKYWRTLCMCAGYSVDISLPQLRVAVEADGPTHMPRNAPSRSLGATALKRRHLSRMGWQVVSVTFKVCACMINHKAKNVHTA